MSELDDLKRQVNELKDQLNPPPRQPSTHPRFDPTEGMSMPASAMRDLINAVPESVMRGIVADSFKPNPITGGGAPSQSQPVQRSSGWRDEVPISSPPGIAICDRMMDEQDRIDKAELAMKLAKAEMLKK